MLLRNKEGNCVRDAKSKNKIEALKALGYVEVVPAASKEPKVKETADKKGAASKEPKVKETADGGVAVTL